MEDYTIKRGSDFLKGCWLESSLFEVNGELVVPIDVGMPLPISGVFFKSTQENILNYLDAINGNY